MPGPVSTGMPSRLPRGVAAVEHAYVVVSGVGQQPPQPRTPPATSPRRRRRPGTSAETPIRRIARLEDPGVRQRVPTAATGPWVVSSDSRSTHCAPGRCPASNSGSPGGPFSVQRTSASTIRRRRCQLGDQPLDRHQWTVHSSSSSARPLVVLRSTERQRVGPAGLGHGAGDAAAVVVAAEHLVRDRGPGREGSQSPARHRVSDDHLGTLGDHPPVDRPGVVRAPVSRTSTATAPGGSRSGRPARPAGASRETAGSGSRSGCRPRRRRLSARRRSAPAGRSGPAE